MTQPKRALGGLTPLRCCDTEIGAREVESLLGRIKHGFFLMIRAFRLCKTKRLATAFMGEGAHSHFKRTQMGPFQRFRPAPRLFC